MSVLDELRLKYNNYPIVLQLFKKKLIKISNIHDLVRIKAFAKKRKKD